MGTIKIELDLPNFEKELELKVILNKDGVQSSTPSISITPDQNPIWRQVPSQYPSPSVAPTITCVNNEKTNANTIVGKPVETVTYGSIPNDTVSSGSKIPSSMMGNY